MRISADAQAHVPTSVVLERLLDDAPADRVTLEWLLASLRERSFGIVMLILGLSGLAPGMSAIAGVVLTILAFQMIMARSAPIFPRIYRRPTTQDSTDDPPLRPRSGGAAIPGEADTSRPDR